MVRDTTCDPYGVTCFVRHRGRECLERRIIPSVFGRSVYSLYFSFLLILLPILPFSIRPPPRQVSFTNAFRCECSPITVPQRLTPYVDTFPFHSVCLSSFRTSTRTTRPPVRPLVPTGVVSRVSLSIRVLPSSLPSVCRTRCPS